MKSQFREFLSGAKRGVKFGATAGLCILFGLYGMALQFVLLNPQLRADAAADFHKQSLLSAVGGVIAIVSLMAFYGAVPGAIIMGIVAVLRAKGTTPNGDKLRPSTSN